MADIFSRNNFFCLEFLCDVMHFQAKLRKAYNWYQSRSLVTKLKSVCELDKANEVVELVAVNAFNTFSYECISVQPYILLDPYLFDAELPKIWNYAINTVLSHELGHSFGPVGIFHAGLGENLSLIHI